MNYGNKKSSIIKNTALFKFRILNYGFTIVLLLKVTDAIRASKRPWIVAPVFIDID